MPLTDGVTFRLLRCFQHRAGSLRHEQGHVKGHVDNFGLLNRSHDSTGCKALRRARGGLRGLKI